MTSNKPRLLVAASGGGHWVQLLRLRPAFEGFDTAYVSMFGAYKAKLPDVRFYTVRDASRLNPFAFIPVLLTAARIVYRERPAAIVTTGSAPMLALILLGRLTGAQTLWIDSIANVQRLSTSGRLARKIAHKVLSQWPAVARREGVEYWGAIL